MAPVSALSVTRSASRRLRSSSVTNDALPLTSGNMPNPSNMSPRSYSEMSADFSEMNLRSSSLETYQNYTSQQLYPENVFDVNSNYSIQLIPLGELLAQTPTNPEYPEDSLPTRSQRGLSEVDSQMLSALMEIRDHLPSDRLSGSREFISHIPEAVAEQTMIESIEKEDQEYIETDSSCGYESEIDITDYPNAPYIDSDFYPDPPISTSPSPSHHRSPTLEVELPPSPNATETRKTKARPRPERKVKWSINPFRQCQKMLDSNLRIAIFTRKDHEKYAKILGKYDQSTLRKSRRRKEIRANVNRRGLDYQRGFMRWRTHERSKLAIEWYLRSKTEGLEAKYHTGRGMAVEGGYLVRNEGQSMKDCGWFPCLVGGCGWRGMEICLFPAGQPMELIGDAVDEDMYM